MEKVEEMGLANSWYCNVRFGLEAPSPIVETRLIASVRVWEIIEEFIL